MTNADRKTKDRGKNVRSEGVRCNTDRGPKAEDRKGRNTHVCHSR